MTDHSLPAVLGGPRAFPDGLALVRPVVGDVPALRSRLGDILASGHLTNGPTVRELEERLADRLQVAHVVAVSSCTAGLMLVLSSLGARGRVVMPSMTFAASAHAVSWAGGRPVFADVAADSLTLDPASAVLGLEGASAITATHIYGTPCDVAGLQAVADAAGVPLVFDAAHALGSSRAGRPIGGFGAAEVFSMSPTKVTTAGEGGIVATQHDEIAQHVRLGRNYGNSGDYDCAFPGLNARMSELHAAVALSGLVGLDERLAHRRGLVEAFWSAVSGVPGLRRPVLAEGDESTYKDLTLVVDPAALGLDVPDLTAALSAEGIDSRRYFFPPIHRQKAYADLPADLDLSVTEDVCTRVITPPLWSAMTTADVERLAALVTRLHEHAAQVRRRLGRPELETRG